MDTVEKIEEYLQSLEDYFFSSLSAATTDLPTVHEAVNRLWVDISRYGPGLPAFPEVHMPQIPGLGTFQVPPPPPPPQILHRDAWIQRSATWVGRHPWKASGIVISVVGATLLVGYRRKSSAKRHGVFRTQSQSHERRQVVVVLGGDAPLSLPLIQDLEAKGYIVIASVSTADAVDALESKCHGYVKALVLDPQELATIPIFLRSLSSTLSRRFPLSAAGDPHASPANHPYIHSVISLLTLSAPSVAAPHAPLEHVNLQETYLPYLTATQITPLQIIQALMPLLRTGSARSRDKGGKSIIVCLPATDARVGLPFSSVQAMSAAGTLRGVEVMRREINAAGLTDQSHTMKNIKVVVVDVGIVGSQPAAAPADSIMRAMEGWTPSERSVYGPAFISVQQVASSSTSRWAAIRSIFHGAEHFGVQRTPTDVNVFVRDIVGVVSGGRFGPTLFGLGLGLGQFRNWVRGRRFSVGAGAHTYMIASHLPSLLLDTILNIPHFLVSIRNGLLPIQPSIRDQPRNLPVVSPKAVVPSSQVSPQESLVPESHAEDTNEGDAAESGSEGDVVSESGEGSTNDSWIALGKSQDSPV